MLKSVEKTRPKTDSGTRLSDIRCKTQQKSPEYKRGSSPFFLHFLPTSQSFRERKRYVAVSGERPAGGGAAAPRRRHGGATAAGHRRRRRNKGAGTFRSASSRWAYLPSSPESESASKGSKSVFEGPESRVSKVQDPADSGHNRRNPTPPAPSPHSRDVPDPTPLFCSASDDGGGEISGRLGCFRRRRRGLFSFVLSPTATRDDDGDGVKRRPRRRSRCHAPAAAELVLRRGKNPRSKSNLFYFLLHASDPQSRVLIFIRFGREGFGWPGTVVVHGGGAAGESPAAGGHAGGGCSSMQRRWVHEWWQISCDCWSKQVREPGQSCGSTVVKDGWNRTRERYKTCLTFINIILRLIIEKRVWLYFARPE
jgi:hypothetical protein